MSEKRPQSTVQPEQIQGFNSPVEDELNLINLLEFLVRKKVFILAVTSVFTLFAIFYVQSTAPVYRATVGILDHKETFSSSSIIEQLDLQLSNKQSQTSTPISLFERFLFNIKSHEFTKEVFVNGGFQEKFSGEKEVDTDQSVSAIYNSTKIVEHRKSFYLELDGSKPKLMLEFLKALIETAKEKVNTEINDIQRSAVKTEINNLSTQIGKLQQEIIIEKKKQAMQKQKEIVRLSEALAIAKHLGIKNNNFAPGNQQFPLWFKYGELALQQEINILRSKKGETSKTKNLLAKLKLKKSQIPDLPLLKFKVVTIGKYGYSLTEPALPWMIVGFGVVFGLFISIFMAFLIDLKNR